jgi:hypothetical protein
LPPISKPRLRALGKSGSFAGIVEHPEVVADRLEDDARLRNPWPRSSQPQRCPECAMAVIS